MTKIRRQKKRDKKISKMTCKLKSTNRVTDSKFETEKRVRVENERGQKRIVKK